MDIFKKLLGGNAPISVSQPLKRSKKKLQEVESYANKKQTNSLFATVLKDIKYDDGKLKTSEGILRLKSEQSNGLIFLKSYYSGEPLWCWMEIFKQKILSLGYRQQNADKHIIEKGDYVSTRERYYLKPQPTFEIPLKQLFGNILLELDYRDRKEELLKIQVNVYSGYDYKEPLEFLKLIEKLFEKA